MIKLLHTSNSTNAPKAPKNKKQKSIVRSLVIWLGVILLTAFAVGTIGIPIFTCYALLQGLITGAQFVSVIGLYTPIYEIIPESVIGLLEVIPSIIPI